MFPYADPTGTDCLQRLGALKTYRGLLTGQYDSSSKKNNTKFIPIARLSNLQPGAQAGSASVPWVAFPIRKADNQPQVIDRDRSLQEEYVEWVVQRSGDTMNTITNITFTTEFASYFQTLANHSFEALVAGIKDIIPTANPTVQELYGIDQKPVPLVADGEVGSKTWDLLKRILNRDLPINTPVLRLGSRGEAVVWLQTWLNWLGFLDSTPDGAFGAKTQAAVIAVQKQYAGGGDLFLKNLPNNPWNTGVKGILCLTNRFNTLPFLFDLLTDCAVPRSDLQPDEVCRSLGGSCVSARSSDPRVCTETQKLATRGNLLSLADPVGVNIFDLQGNWQLNGETININDPQTNRGLWQISRGRHRAILRNLPGLTVDSAPIKTGAQVARKLRVSADVMFAPASAVKS